MNEASPELSRDEREAKCSLFAESARRTFYDSISSRGGRLGKLILDAFEESDYQFEGQAIDIAAGMWRTGFKYTNNGRQEKMHCPFLSVEYPPYNSNPDDAFAKLIQKGKSVYENEFYKRSFNTWLTAIQNGQTAYGYEVIAQGGEPAH